MSDHGDQNVHEDPGAADAAARGHEDAHGAAANHAGHDGHDGMDLGPIDWAAWAVGIVAVAAGLIVAVCAAISTGAIAV